MKSPRKLTGIAAKTFTRLAKQLPDLRPCDADALALYSESYADAIAARETLDKEGRYKTIGTNGAMQLHPACSDLKNATDTMLKLGRRLGLDPDSRAKMKTPPPTVNIELPGDDEN